MFSEMGTYPAVGLFSEMHIISIVMCFLLVGIAVFFTRHISRDRYMVCLRVFTLILTVLEIFKISWNLKHGYNSVDSWLPLYFCSLFLYALWFTWSSKSVIREIGLAYIAMACVIAGTVFIVFPTTSFSSYPIFHFQCIYSMIYHSVMIYSGIMLFKTKTIDVDLKLVIKYVVFCAIFMSLGLLVNLMFDGNMMFLSNPYRIPIPALTTIHEFSQFLYTLTIVVAHMLMGPFVLGIHILGGIIFNKKELPLIEPNSIDINLMDDEEMQEKEI